ncbi:hypothetical protein ACN47E_005016 [Coniothyrium glycines]
MTAQAFEAILAEPDGEANRARLHALIAAQDYSGDTLPAVAAQYLLAFCDTTSLFHRRRWFGIAIAGMLRASDAVRQHLTQPPTPLQGLGAVVLRGEEREDIKIVAGIVIRQALECGINYGSFWTTSKIQDSAPNFPKNLGRDWMQQYQEYLDTLDGLALADTATDSSVTSCVSVVTSDGSLWPREHDGNLLAILQTGLLTVLVLDFQLQDVQFVDVCLKDIRNLRIFPSETVDSQIKVRSCRPWDLAMSLCAGRESYRINMSGRTATSFTMTFREQSDAKEWQRYIREAQNEEGGVKSVLDRSSMSPELSVVAQEGDCSQSTRRRRLPWPNQNENVLDESTTDKDVQQHKAKPQSWSKRPKSKETVKKLNTDQERDLSVADSDDGLLDHSIRSKDLDLYHSPSKRDTFSKGKLSQVSQSVKRKNFKQMRTEMDDPDYSDDNMQGTASKKQKQRTGVTNTRPSASRTSRPTKLKAGSCTKLSDIRKSKGSADDEDDYIVPGKPGARKANIRHRNLQPNTEVRSSTATKKAQTKQNDASIGEKEKLLPNAANTMLHRTRRGLAESRNTLQLHGNNSPVLPLEHPAPHTLIKNPMVSLVPNDEQKSPFRKPEAQTQSQQPPLTPTGPRRSANTVAHVLSKTPASNINRTTEHVGDFIGSSPPLMYSSFAPQREHWGRDAEILSSNSKPIPASPTADSTAISGLAALEDMDVEKQKGDWQTAQSDPFGFQRTYSKPTALLRRFTGDGDGKSSSCTETTKSTNVPADKERGCTVDITANGSHSLPRPMLRHKVQTVMDTHSVHDDVSDSQRTSASELQLTTATNERGPKHGQNANIQSSSAAQRASAVSSTVSAPTSLSVSAMGKANEHTAPQIATQLTTEDSNLPMKLALIDKNHASKKMEEHDNANLDEDATLVDQANNTPTYEGSSASVLHFLSFPSGNPHDGHSSSSHSSSSDGPDPQTPGGTLPPSSEAEEMEWEATLEPHQRSLHDLLMRTSKQVVRHIVDNETAVSDIADIFERDAEHVVEAFLNDHNGTYELKFEQMNKQRDHLKKELENTKKRMMHKHKPMGVIK